MGNVKRIYVEKKDDYAVKGKELLEDMKAKGVQMGVTVKF